MAKSNFRIKCQEWKLIISDGNLLGSGSGGQISWDRNLTFLGGWHFDDEIKIPNNDSISWSQHFSWDQN